MDLFFFWLSSAVRWLAGFLREARVSIMLVTHWQKQTKRITFWLRNLNRAKWTFLFKWFHLYLWSAKEYLEFSPSYHFVTCHSLNSSCVITWVPALQLGWTLKEGWDLAQAWWLFLLQGMPWCPFLCLLEPSKTLQPPVPVCLTGVTMCVLWWIWDFLKATSFSEDGPHKRGAPVKYLQGAQHTTSVLSKSCSSGVQILDYFCRAVLDKPTQPMSIFLVQRFGILTVLRL